MFESVYTQTIHIQQPNEIYDGNVNLCDGCVNMMVSQGRLINSCRLDEYRMFGRPVTVISVKGSQKIPD